MARNLRVEYPGAIYHVTCRMIGDWRTEKTQLFRDDKDRQRFIDQLEERVERYNIRLYLFVCMTNHFHLVFETPEANCSKFMQSLSTAYTVYHNLRHKRHGHLLDGRYKAKLVEGDDYLMSLSRYVHLNPVHVASRKRKSMEENIKYLNLYRWSTYPGYIGKQKPFGFVEYSPILAEMSGKKSQWRKRYRRFVEAGLAESDDIFMDALKESSVSIGSDSFRGWVDELYHAMVEGHAVPEDISFRRLSEPLLPDRVLEALSNVFSVDVQEFKKRRRNSPLRAIAARLLMKYASQNQRQVAEYLEAGSGAAISKQISRQAELLSNDRKLIRMITEVEKVLDKEKEYESESVKS